MTTWDELINAMESSLPTDAEFDQAVPQLVNAAHARRLSARLNREWRALVEAPEGAASGRPPKIQLHGLFEIFTGLEMRPGYTLDYVYASIPGVAGEPFLYARENSEAPLADFDGYRRKFNLPFSFDPGMEWPGFTRWFPVLNFMKTPLDASTKFELAMFIQVAQSFHLFGASKRGEIKYVNTAGRLANLRHTRQIGSPLDQESPLPRVDPVPQVATLGPFTRVRLLIHEPDGRFAWLYLYFNGRFYSRKKLLRWMFFDKLGTNLVKYKNL